MPTLGAGQLASLRTHPQKIGRMGLYVFVPDEVLTGAVAGLGADPHVQAIPYAVGAGNFVNVLRGHTLRVEDATGRYKGIIRIRQRAGAWDGRGADAANIYVSEHEVPLANGDALTVLDEFRLWNIPSFITNAGVIYKDWDGGTEIAWPGPNLSGDAGLVGSHQLTYQPVPVLGPPLSIEFLSGGVATHAYDWRRSWGISPSTGTLSYAATFPGGAPANSALSNGTVTWNTAGYRWGSLAVTDDLGAGRQLQSYPGRRLFVTLDKDNLPANCYVDFVPSARSGDVDSGGFSMSFTIYTDAPESAFPDGALVAWFTFQEGTQEDIEGNWPDRAHIHFVGYIRRAGTHKEPETGAVSFEATTLQSVTQALTVFPNFVEDEAAPDVWTEAATLTVQRAAYLHMRWQSTLLEMADVIFAPAATTAIGEQEFPEGSLYQQLVGLVDRDYRYRIGCDPHSTVYFNKDPQYLPRPGAFLPPAGIDTIMTVEAQDWQGSIDFPELLEPQTGYIMASGNAFTAPATVVPLFSEADGPVPLERGGKEDQSRLILTTQANLNILSGLALAQRNCDFPDVPVALDGQYYIGHLFPQEFVGLNIDPTDTRREMDLQNVLFIPRRSELQVVLDKDGAPSHCQVSINLEKLTYGYPGQTLVYPGSGSSTPTSSLTPEEPPFPPGSPIYPGGGTAPPGFDVAYFVLGPDGGASAGHIIRATNVWGAPASVVYEDLGLVDAGGLYWIALDQFDPENRAMVCGPNGVWSTTNLADAVPVWALEITTPGGFDGFSMVRSSPIQDQMWQAVCIDFAGPFPPGEVRVYWTTNDGTAWNSRNVASVDCGVDPSGTLSRGCAYLELSSHDANKAWISYYDYGSWNLYVAITSNMWAAATCNGYVGCFAHGQYVYKPCSHHRHTTNPNDLIAVWGGVDQPAAMDVNALYVTVDISDPAPTCTVLCSDPAGGDGYAVREIGCWKSATNRWWALIACNGNYKWFISDNGTVWVETVTFPGVCRRAADWVLDADWFIVAEDGDGAVTGPLRLSSDRGTTFVRLTGDWAALCIALGWVGANSPTPECIAPMIV